MRMKFGLLAVVLCLAAPIGAQADVQQGATISVSGNGVHHMQADMARFRVAVTKDAREPELALQKVATAALYFMNELSDLGVADKDMQTAQVNLSPKYGSSNIKDGYRASTDVLVEIYDLENLGAIMSAVVHEGANGLAGLQFDLKNRREAEDIARIDAVQDAIAKAKVMAQAAGVVLGGLVSIDEGAAARPFQPGLRMAMSHDGADMPIAAGEIEISSSVNMVFKLHEE